MGLQNVWHTPAGSVFNQFPLWKSYKLIWFTVYKTWWSVNLPLQPKMRNAHFQPCSTKGKYCHISCSFLSFFYFSFKKNTFCVCTFQHFIVPCEKFRSPYLGKAQQLQEQCALLISTRVCTQHANCNSISAEPKIQMRYFEDWAKNKWNFKQNKIVEHARYKYINK